MDVILQAKEIPPDLVEFFEPVEFGHKKGVWTLGPESYKGAHFATFPTKLVRPCIRAGTSEAGACPRCGAGWVRVVEKTKGDTEAQGRPKKTAGMNSNTSTLSLSGNGSAEWAKRGGRTKTTGWQPACTCTDEHGEPYAPVPQIVLDLFCGSGTTGAEAKAAGRWFIGIDLSPEYLKLAEKRINTAQPTFDDVPPEQPTMEQLKF